MFCPKCATQNIEGASFCRSCGANISLVPQALSGRLPKPQTDSDWDSRGKPKRRRKREEPVSLERGIVSVFMGVGFLIAALAVMFKFPGGFTWGWAFFIPAFSCFGKGVAMIVSARRQNVASLPPASDFPPNAYQGPPGRVESAASRTAELMPPAPSVTESTTRHLGAEAPTRTFDSLSGEKRS